MVHPAKNTFCTEDTELITGARDELRLDVPRALDGNPELSQRQLAIELGVSPGGVNYALNALIKRGSVKADNFRKAGSKAAYLYVIKRPRVSLKKLRWRPHF